MGTVVYRDAYILVDGANLRAEFSELAVEHGAEDLDGTTFGQDTRVHKGGLLLSRITGAGYAALGANAAEEIVMARVGTDDTMVVVFPDGITEGTTTKKGYAMLGMLQTFDLGGAVGVLLPFSFVAECRNPIP